ncbi:hypothetical protein HDU96_005301, partial [Phlyctochytrium bullatum]
LIKENYEMHRRIAALEARLTSLESRQGDTGEAPKPADACLQSPEPTTAPSGPYLPAADPDDTAQNDASPDTRPSYAAAAAAPNPSAPRTPAPNPIAHPAFGARPRRQNAYTHVYARLSIHAELPRPRHREFVRQALQATGAGDGIVGVSPVGRSVVHLLISDRSLARTTTALEKMDALLPSFDPLAPPPHVFSPAQADAHRSRAPAAYVERIAIMLAAASGARYHAILDAVPAHLREQAATSAASRRRDHEDYLARQAQPTAPPTPVPAATPPSKAPVPAASPAKPASTARTPSSSSTVEPLPVAPRTL